MSEEKKYTIARGPASKYDPEGKHKDMLYYAEDENFFAVNGKRTVNTVDNKYFHLNKTDISINKFDNPKDVNFRNINLSFGSKAEINIDTTKNTGFDYNYLNILLGSVSLRVKVLSYVYNPDDVKRGEVTITGFDIGEFTILIQESSEEEYIKRGGIYNINRVDESGLKYILLGYKISTGVINGKLAYTYNVIDTNITEPISSEGGESFKFYLNSSRKTNYSIVDKSATYDVSNTIILGGYNAVEKVNKSVILGSNNNIRKVKDNEMFMECSTMFGHNNRFGGTDEITGTSTCLNYSILGVYDSYIPTAYSSVILGSTSLTYNLLEETSPGSNKFYLKESYYNRNIGINSKYLIDNFSLSELKYFFIKARIRPDLHDLYISDVEIDNNNSNGPMVVLSFSKPYYDYFSKRSRPNILIKSPNNRRINIGFSNFTPSWTSHTCSVTCGVGNICITPNIPTVSYGMCNALLNELEATFGICNCPIRRVSRLTLGVGSSLGRDIIQKNAYMYTNDGKHYFAGVGGYEGTERELTPSIKDLKSILDSKAEVSQLPDISILATKDELEAKVNQLTSKIEELTATIQSLTRRLTDLEQKS